MSIMMHIYVVLGLLLVLLISPAIAFLLGGWEVRRRNIVETLSDEAIRCYFRAFYPNVDIGKKPRATFDAYYRSEFGRHRFVWPLLLLTLLVGVIFYWSAPSISDLLQYEMVDSGKLPFLAMVAFMGAYMWVLFDQIMKWYASELSPGDIYWWCFRFAIAIPMGYALKDVFSESFSPAVVFLLGALPTSQIMRIAKRVVRERTGVKTDNEATISELQKLQGIDTAKAEQFEAEGITTILKLAYFDPIRLTIRTGFNYSYIVDCACQALLWIYVEDEITKLRKSGLRSAYEIAHLWYRRTHGGEKETDELIRLAAKDLKRDNSAMLNVLEQVAIDPYTQFLFLSWADYTQEEMGPVPGIAPAPAPVIG